MAKDIVTLKWKPKPMLDRSLKGMMDIVNAEAFEFEKFVKVDMGNPKTGEDYKRGAKTHIASAEGEAPAVDTGQLRNALGHQLRKMRASFEVLIGFRAGGKRAKKGFSLAERSLFLEHELDRPHIVPATKRMVKRIRRRMAGMKI